MFEDKIREAEIIFEEVKKNATLRLEVLKLDAVHHVAKLSANLITNTFTVICVRWLSSSEPLRLASFSQICLTVLHSALVVLLYFTYWSQFL